MTVLLLVLIALIAYALGALNSPTLLARFVFGKDLRRMGNGRASYANFTHVFGDRWGLAVMGVDVLKGVIAVLLGALLLSIPGDGFPVIGKLFAGFCLTLGSVYPIQNKFRGSKGIICCIITLWLTDWRVGLVASAVYIIVIAFSQYVSLAGLCACVSGVPAAWIFISGENLKGLAGTLALFMALVIVWRNRGSIFRLLEHKEPKVKWGNQTEKKMRDSF